MNTLVSNFVHMSVGGSDAGTPPQPPRLLAAGAPPLSAFPPGAAIRIVLVEVMEEKKTIDGAEYYVVRSHLAANFDASKGYKVEYFYDRPEEYEGQKVLGTEIEEERGFILNGEVPEVAGVGVLPYVYMTELYFPAELEDGVWFHAYITDEGGDHRNVIYKRNGDVRANDVVAVYEDKDDYIQTDVVAEDFSITNIDLTKPTNALTTQLRTFEGVANAVKLKGRNSQAVSGELTFPVPANPSNANGANSPKVAKIGLGEVSVTNVEDYRVGATNLGAMLSERRGVLDLGVYVETLTPTVFDKPWVYEPNDDGTPRWIAGTVADGEDWAIVAWSAGDSLWRYTDSTGVDLTSTGGVDATSIAFSRNLRFYRAGERTSDKLAKKSELPSAVSDAIAARLSGIDPETSSVYDLIKALKGE